MVERVARWLAGARRLAYACSEVEVTVHNVGGWTARWARVAPDRLAVVDGDLRLTYAEFDDRVARTAGWLAGRGVARGDRVAIVSSNCAAYLELVLGAARVGALSVPINTRLSPRELAFQLDDCRPALVVCEPALRETLLAAGTQTSHELAQLVEVGDRYDRELAIAPASGVTPVAADDPMMILYTSGTTGSPKGAVLPHRKTLYNALNAQLYFGIRSGEDRVLVASPLFHSLGLKILSLPVLYAGGTLVLLRRFDPAEFWRAVTRERITYSGGVPTQYRRLLEQLGGAARELDRSSLRFLFTAGAAVAPETVRAYQRQGLVLKQGFGQTETSILCCLHEDDAVRKAGSVGRPVFHAELRIVDRECCADPPEDWREVASGEVGEIVVRGPITMLGYWERPDDSAETLRGDWLRTGDLASRDDEGFVTLTGRAHDMYISGGENVYPAEIESVLAEHPAIREVAVIAVPDPDWGEAGRAHAVLEAGATLRLEQLRHWASERLARFKLPRELVIVTSLPRTASGKVQKHELG
ncbi:MAG: long-chain fatty acid--CoA ligase [Myxococcota bacterium]|nr:long-chain fatty acid--CoA ligase [Myxococcota bacterium]